MKSCILNWLYFILNFNIIITAKLCSKNSNGGSRLKGSIIEISGSPGR